MECSGLSMTRKRTEVRLSRAPISIPMIGMLSQGYAIVGFTRHQREPVQDRGLLCYAAIAEVISAMMRKVLAFRS